MQVGEQRQEPIAGSITRVCVSMYETQPHCTSGKAGAMPDYFGVVQHPTYTITIAPFPVHSKQGRQLAPVHLIPIAPC